MAQVRTERFNMVMTKREIEILRELAADDGMSASDYVRQLIHKAHRERSKETNGARRNAR